MGDDSGRAITAVGFEMRTFWAHFGIADHISFDVPVNGDLNLRKSGGVFFRA